MDCDTTGMDFAMVKFKKLAGGGYFKIVNQSVPGALEKLGYAEGQIAEIVSFTRFEPGGIVEGHPNVKSTSIIDYVFRVVGVEYLKRYDFAQVPPDEEQDELVSATDVSAAQRAAGRTVPPQHPPRASHRTQTSPARPSRTPQEAVENALSHQLGEMMADAPMCEKCGNITVRNGACHECLNCGNSMGYS